ncbi:MAG: hypothetical protein JWO50_346 [Candidatus Kaiserbacteria bacterium]|nr:hypothetical protein [Candidatus Kaiserbacteria bacterium]
MHLALFTLALLWSAYCLAKLEIQIEGAHGWAELLPAWHMSNTSWINKVLFSERPLTGYHVWLVIFLLSMFHVVYVFTPPSWYVELQIVSFFCFFSVVEDFLWFLLNPAFGIHNFKREKIWWHEKNWWIIAPRDYYILTAVGVITYLLAPLV